MKIESKLKEEFQPIEIKVTIESQKELDILLDFFSRDSSIPDHFKSLLVTRLDAESRRNFISTYMTNFHDAILRSKVNK